MKLDVDKRPLGLRIVFVFGTESDILKLDSDFEAGFLIVHNLHETFEKELTNHC